MVRLVPHRKRWYLRLLMVVMAFAIAAGIGVGAHRRPRRHGLQVRTGTNRSGHFGAAEQPGEPVATADIVRFLEQATWGPTPELIEHVRQVGFEGFLDEQFNAPMSSYPTLPLCSDDARHGDCPNGSTCQRDNYTMYPLQNRFFVNALYGQDQLRQRVAFALHQIIVVSGVEVNPAKLDGAVSSDPRPQRVRQLPPAALRDHAQPGDGQLPRHQTGNTRTHNRPNENYAREILQLFSIGTVRLNPRWHPAARRQRPADPDVRARTTVNNFARVFTGWRSRAAPRCRPRRTTSIRWSPTQGATTQAPRRC